MPEDEYDLAGFTVGVVDKAKIWTTPPCRWATSHRPALYRGVHSTEPRLVRKILILTTTPSVEKDL